MLSNNQIRNKLIELSNSYYNDIASCVISEAMEYDDPRNFFEDLAQHGCISGMISSLIYYSDTHKFYDTHYEEIEDVRKELNITIDPDNDLKNHLAWMAFEYKANILVQELGLL